MRIVRETGRPISQVGLGSCACIRAGRWGVNLDWRVRDDEGRSSDSDGDERNRLRKETAELATEHDALKPSAALWLAG